MAALDVTPERWSHEWLADPMLLALHDGEVVGCAGLGLDPDVAHTLFTRFSRGQNQTASAGRQRYGIGLALVREIALAHRGDVRAEPTPGGGATFRLVLPAVSEP